MKNKEEIIRLYWYRYNKGAGNIGDELSNYIISRLSPSKVIYSGNYLLTKKLKVSLKMAFRLLKSGEKSLFEVLTTPITNLSKPKIVMAIGSILYGKKDYPNLHVWGSGIISKKAKLYDVHYHAVRGEYTRAHVKNSGFKPPQYIGDPGMLSPLVYTPKKEKQYKIGIIPHYSHYNFTKEILNNNPSIKLINVLDDVETFLSDINACEYIISSSLHGVILSHAYRVPALWINSKIFKTELSGDNIKFKDYFSSIKMDEYHAIDIDDINDVEAIIATFKENQHLNLPKEENVISLQKGLLKCAPFKLKQEYIDFANS